MKKLILLLIIFSSLIGYSQIPKRRSIQWEKREDTIFTKNKVRIDSTLTLMKIDGGGTLPFIIGWDSVTGRLGFADTINFKGVSSIEAISDTSYPIEYLQYTDPYGTHPITSLVKPNGIMLGGIVNWLYDTTFNITPCVYYMFGDLYITSNSIFIINGGDDADPRIDVIAVDTNNMVAVIEGTPSSDPVKPIVDPSSQLEVTQIYVPADAVSFVDSVDQELVYDENVEWTGSASGVTVDFAYAVNPYMNTLCTDVSTLTNGDRITWTGGSTLDRNDYEIFVFAIKLKAIMVVNHNISVRFYLNTTPSSNTVIATIDKSLLTWQTNGIQMSSFEWTTNQFNRVVFSFVRSGGVNSYSGLYLDYVKLEKGIPPPGENKILSLVGDITGAGLTGTNINTTLATVNSNVGTYGGIDTTVMITVDAKGRITAISEDPVTPATNYWTWIDAVMDTLSNNVSTTGIVKIIGALEIDTTTSTGGQIKQYGNPIFHTYTFNRSLANIYIGETSGNFSNTGYLNTALGTGTLNNLTSGFQNTAIGSQALMSITQGGDNTGIGVGAGGMLTSGIKNTVLGKDALFNNISGHYNTAVGFGSMNGIVGQSQTGNTAIGFYSLKNISTNGNYNAAVGDYALYYDSTGDYNVGIGSNSGYKNKIGTNNIFIGYQSGYNETGSNKLYIEPSNSTTPLIYGDFSLDSLVINGDLTVTGIDSLPQSYALYYNKVTGEITYDSAASGDGSVGGADSLYFLRSGQYFTNGWYALEDTVRIDTTGSVPDTTLFDIMFEFKDVTAGTAQTYTLDIKASFDYTILASCLEVDAGTLDSVVVKIGATAVTGLEDIEVDNAVDETTATAANSVSTGDRIYLYISTQYTGAPTLIRGKIKMREP